MISLRQVVQDFNPQLPFRAPSNWLQGRTIFGGLTTALSLESVLNFAATDLPHLRSAFVSFIAPVDGAVSFEPQVLRSGRSVTSVAVDCCAQEHLVMRAVFTLAQQRASDIQHNFLKSPSVDSPHQYAPLSSQAMNELPVCGRNFEMRPVGAALPMSKSKNPELLYWMRHLDASTVDPIVALVVLADAIPPAATTCFSYAAPISTVTWSFDVLDQNPQGKWFLVRAYSAHASNGYSSQDMIIWNESGHPVMWGRQMIAIFT